MDDNKKDIFGAQQPWASDGAKAPAEPASGMSGVPETEKFEIEFEDDFDSWLAGRESFAKAGQPVKTSVAPKPATSEPAKNAPPANQPSSAQFKPVASESGDDIPVNRREAVKNFKLEIDEEEYNKPAYEEDNQPVKKDKAIYFAGRKPRKPQADSRSAQAKSRAAKPPKSLNSSSLGSMPMEKLRRVVLLASIFVCAVVIAAYGISCINDVLAISRDDELITVNVEKDSDYKQIINTLGDSGLIKHEWFCKFIGKFRGFDDEEYLYGLHYLTPDMGIEGMLTAMLADQTSDKTIRLSFPEGWTIPQIVAKLAENNVCPAEYIYDSLAEVEFEYDFINQIPESDDRCYALEGYIFPDTYDFFVSEKPNGIGENPTSIINKFLGNFEAKWSDVYTKRAKELGITMDEVLIIASIIQKEAADKSQMTKVSSVIHNRLNNRASYPTLGCDSTKNYVTNYLSTALGSSAASAYLGGYDTNSVRSGLPSGPICNPGVDAIEAALNPDDTDYYYFCHNNDGKIYLAETYSEFQANWSQVLRDNEEN